MPSELEIRLSEEKFPNDLPPVDSPHVVPLNLVRETENLLLTGRLLLCYVVPATDKKN